jgi:hypothetical protein
MRGRITFRKNPWPKGHAIATLNVAGRVDPEKGLFLDVHLRSADYEADPPAVVPDDLDLPDWKAVSVWGNYHRCTLSSVNWPGEAEGLLVATPKKPLARAQLSGRSPLRDLAKHVETRALHIYLLGHDSVLSDDLRLTRKGATWSLAWKGRLALTYAGDSVFRHRFEANATGVTFIGFVMPKKSTKTEAQACGERFARPGVLKVTKRGGAFFLAPA